MSSSAWLSFVKSSMLLASEPQATAIATTDTVHQSTAPRCSRKARASGRAQPGAAAGRPGPGRHQPGAEVAPGLQPARRRAPARRAASTHRSERPPPRRRRRAGPSAPSPIGEAHDSAPRPGVADRPHAGTTPPSTAPASPDATRGFSVTCAVTAAIAGEHEPERGERRAEHDRPGHRQVLGRRTHGHQHADDEVRAAHDHERPAASGAWRPTGIARTSSSRPLSSSPRVKPDDEQQAHEPDEGEARPRRPGTRPGRRSCRARRRAR